MTSAQTLDDEKVKVPQEFDRVARTYDFLTGMNPGYSKHLRWSAERLRLGSSARALDLCCGTGLSTAALVRAYPRATVTALDASHGMLEIARKKTELRDVTFFEGDAMNPAASGATGPYDGILMAYGLRNMPDRDICLDRLFALLEKGGTICFHEYSVKESAVSRAVWNAVCACVIIPSGAIVGGSTDIYRYLRRSVLDFDGTRELEERLRRHGFIDVRTEPMDGWQRGVLHSFLATRPR